MTNITNFDPASGATLTQLVTTHDRGSNEFNCRLGGGDLATGLTGVR